MRKRASRVSAAKSCLKFGKHFMSRLAKKPIAVGKTTVEVASGTLSIKGPKGTLTKRVHPSVDITVGADGVVITPKNSSRLAKTLTGTFASHVRNMISG